MGTVIAWTIDIAFYAALAVLVTWLSWRHALGLVGLTLCLCSIVTNIAYFGASLESRVTLEVIQAVVIVNSARLAFRAGHQVAAALIAALACLDLAFCGAVALSPSAAAWKSYVFGRITNGIFLVQCLCVAVPGVRDVMVSGLSSLPWVRRVGHAGSGGNVRRDTGIEE